MFSITSWKCVFYAAVFSLVAVGFNARAGSAFEGSSLGFPDQGQPTVTVGTTPQMYPRVHQLSELRQAPVTRRKRNILFPSGVKLCAEETAKQVVANHLGYFHLRVCQETVWEAFKVFWDRLPEQEEYQSWMSQCQDGAVTAHNIGSYFSLSKEHQALVKRRMSLQGTKSEPTRSWQHMCSLPTAETRLAEAHNPAEEGPAGAQGDTERELAAAVVPPTELEVEEEGKGEAAVVTVASSLDNDIAVEPPTSPMLEQVVEMSIFLTGERYSEALRDPASFQHQTLKRQFTEKMEDALERLPGFKSAWVVDFRPQKDVQGLEGVVVDYAVTVLVNGVGVSSEQLDYLTLQSNRVENSYHKVEGRPTVVHSVSEVRIHSNEALHKAEADSVSHGSPESSESPGSRSETFDQDTVDTLYYETADVPALDGGSEDSKDDFLVETGQMDVIVLEESPTESPAPAPTTGPTGDSIKEEGLIPGDFVLSPAMETEHAEMVTIPMAPVKAEASGLGPGDLADPSPSTASPTTAEEGNSPEQTDDDDGLIGSEKDEIEEDAISGNVFVEAEIEPEVETVEDEEAANDAGTNRDELALNADEIPPELEISTTVTETIEEEDLPKRLPAPKVEAPPLHVEEAGESLGPSQSVDTEPFPGVNHGSPEVLVEDTTVSEAPSGQPDDEHNDYWEEEEEEEAEERPVADGNEGKAGTEQENEEALGEVIPEPSAVEDGTPGSPAISAGDLSVDEILLVNHDELEPPVNDSLNPIQPTALSPEIESPFTDVAPAVGKHPDIVSMEVQTTEVDLVDVTDGDYDVIHYGYGVTNHTEEGGSGFPSGAAHGTDQAIVAMPVMPRRALMVFFSLRVTNMVFSEDLFNKSSAEYKSLEQRFLELLVPYLQSNLTNFQNLEILNFRNGSIVVNSRMKFGKPVPRGVTTDVYLILEDFCNTAYQTMNLAIDKYSLDVESGDQADPCKFQACNEYAECKVNRWSGEAECVCNAGYFSVDGLPCQSICDLKTDFCLNDGKCDIIPGQGAICRCRVGENWWYRGEHCEEYVSEPLVVGIAIASVAGFLLVASGVIFFLARTLRDQYDKDESEDPIRRAESPPSLERATKYNPMYESEATTGYSHYYRRYPEAPVYSSESAEASTEFSSEEVRHIYENSELTKEEIQDRIRIIELYAKDRQFADFVRQHQATLDTRRESSSIPP